MLSESRKNFRIKENLGVTWQLKDEDVQGQGKILNMSTTGVLLSTKDFPDTLPSNIFQMDSILNGGDKFLPSEGRLVWSEKKRNRVFCGIEFIDAPEPVLSNLRERIQQQITKATKSRKIKTWVGSGLIVIMFGLISFILVAEKSIFENLNASNQMLMHSSGQQAELTRTYTKLYQETKEILEVTQKELDATKVVLAETDRLLEEARVENQKLQNQLAGMTGDTTEIQRQQAESVSIRSDLTKKIQELTQLNDQYVEEINELKEKVRIFEGDIKSQEEGKQVLALFYSRIKKVKGNMNAIKREARFSKIVAQKEKDRILFLEGNQGFFYKDGKEFYNGNPKEPGQDVQIGVTFVE